MRKASVPPVEEPMTITAWLAKGILPACLGKMMSALWLGTTSSGFLAEAPLVICPIRVLGFLWLL
ncbi:hypothetical protein JOS77_00180 [Chromobacterium haemolyticum]|nr:hypothetical protein JOS77_00180 [Chromobacterium haemolyticum]